MVGTHERDRGDARQRGAGGGDAREAGDGAPMRVLALDPRGGTLARCAGVDGLLATVETALIGPLEPGAVVLVRAGLALARLDLEWAP